MKIGIMTYHRAENYGALLQAYATMTYLRGLGHDVSFVDYWPKYHSDYFQLFPWHQFKKRSYLGRITFGVQLLLWAIPRFIRKKRLRSFIYDNFGVTTKPLYTNDYCKTEKFDIVVYGSDQIWRKQHLGGVDFDAWYFGSENVQAEKKIVYAGSMGVVDTTAQDNAYVQKMMKNFSEISVRESDLQSYLARLGISTSLVVDPVFLLSKEQWLHVANKHTGNKGKYILFYNLLNTRESMLFAKRLSKEQHLPILEINKRMTFKHIGEKCIMTASVEEFLQLINDAEYVVSNSFHGVAMSLILEKQFYAVGMHKKSNRVKSLLQSTGIPERYIESGSYYTPGQTIDYTEVSKVLHQLSNDSKLFFQQSISEYDGAKG